MLGRYRPRRLTAELQRRSFIVAALPVIVVGGAAAFAYITWSQVREKRRLKEAAEKVALKDQPDHTDDGKKPGNEV
jgi:hypothetical protein